MTTQPNALRLADDLEYHAVRDGLPEVELAAAELRRLHAEVEKLRQWQGEAVAWCALTPSGKIAHFDGKPMVMVGPVGNEHHKSPLYTSPPLQADACKVPQEVIDFLNKREHDSYSCGLLVKDLRAMLTLFPSRDVGEVPHQFVEWLRKEMPPGTEIADPEWWAPRIYRAALSASPTQVETQGDDPCPGCVKGGVCRTPKCGRLKLPVDHPLRSAPSTPPIEPGKGES